MKITDLLKKQSIELHGAVKTKTEAIETMVSLMEKGGNLKDTETYRKTVFARAKESPSLTERPVPWPRPVWRPW